MTHSKEWERDCLRWRGAILTGKYGHWCDDYDGLPVDETSIEWPCACAPEIVAAVDNKPEGSSPSGEQVRAVTGEPLQSPAGAPIAGRLLK